MATEIGSAKYIYTCRCFKFRERLKESIASYPQFELTVTFKSKEHGMDQI